MYATNHVPPLNMDTSTTDCCPKFDPSAWDEETFVFQDKLFVKAATKSFLHMPLNMGSVVTKTWKQIEDAGAKDPEEFIMLSEEASPWRANHYFLVTKEVPGMDNVKLSGSYLAKVFEGPFKDAGKWHTAMQQVVREAGKEPSTIYFYYTTCPKCAKVYGNNYVVGLAKI
jgi:hypothetical protein